MRMANRSRKITATEASLILYFVGRGWSDNELARRFRLHSIYDIKHGINWPGVQAYQPNEPLLPPSPPTFPIHRRYVKYEPYVPGNLPAPYEALQGD
jgi:hypothetical protein